MDTRFLEYYLNDIRDSTAREPGESIEAYMRRTWQMALDIINQEQPPLPRKVKQLERSDRLKQRVGDPVIEKEPEDE